MEEVADLVCGIKPHYMYAKPRVSGGCGWAMLLGFLPSFH